MQTAAFGIWITGLPASGKSTIVFAVRPQLEALGLTVDVLESDAVRRLLTPQATYSEEERDLFYRALAFTGQRLVAHGVTVFSVRDIDRQGIDEVARRAVEIAADGTETTYLSIDIDVLDGAFAWGTCGPEIGGMTGRELVRAIEIVAAGPIGAVDMVEVSPFLDPSGNTARAGARCLIDVLALRAIAVREATAPVAAAGRG